MTNLCNITDICIRGLQIKYVLIALVKKSDESNIPTK